jgi:hypothetical protein
MCQMFVSTDERLRALEVKGEQIIDPATRDSAFALTQLNYHNSAVLTLPYTISCHDTFEDPQQ